MRKLFFGFLLTSPLALGNTSELTLYFKPSPKGIDWTTPASLLKSAVKNKMSFDPRFMGHVFVEFKCGNTIELTGMTGKNFDYLNQIILQGRGLGVLYHSFEGQLENKSELEPELNDLLKEGSVTFTKFLINDGQCQRLTQYLSEYREKNVGRYYGLANRPRFGEGAGCSAFAASFADVAGVMEQEMREAWSQSVYIPMELAGAPIRDEHVTFLKVLMNGNSWATDKEPHKRLDFWNPDKMHAWVNEKIKLKQTYYTVEKIQNAQGVVFDKTIIPAPMGPIWLQQTDPMYQKK